jgi:hypothetical protein
MPDRPSPSSISKLLGAIEARSITFGSRCLMGNMTITGSARRYNHRVSYGPLVFFMNEIIFLVEEDVEGGFVARAIGESIFTQADTIVQLREMVKDAVNFY